MEASGQTQDPATLPVGKEPLLRTEQVAWVDLSRFGILEKKNSFLCHISRPIPSSQQPYSLRRLPKPTYFFCSVKWKLFSKEEEIEYTKTLN
jgi:YHS domain-containing protein